MKKTEIKSNYLNLFEWFGTFWMWLIVLGGGKKLYECIWMRWHRKWNVLKEAKFIGIKRNQREWYVYLSDMCSCVQLLIRKWNQRNAIKSNNNFILGQAYGIVQCLKLVSHQQIRMHAQFFPLLNCFSPGCSYNVGFFLHRWKHNFQFEEIEMHFFRARKSKCFDEK